MCYLPTAEKLSIAILEATSVKVKQLDEKYSGNEDLWLQRNYRSYNIILNLLLLLLLHISDLVWALSLAAACSLMSALPVTSVRLTCTCRNLARFRAAISSASSICFL